MADQRCGQDMSGQALPLRLVQLKLNKAAMRSRGPIQTLSLDTINLSLLMTCMHLYAILLPLKNCYLLSTSSRTAGR